MAQTPITLGPDPRLGNVQVVRAVHPFIIGDRLIEIGNTITVSEARAHYLKFLGLIE